MIKEIKPLNDKQKLLFNAIKNYPMTITTGAAGSGKTFVTSYFAAEMLKQKKIRKVIITRPNVPTGRSIGFFPGDLNEKMAPWVIPVLSVFEEYLGKGDLECQIKKGNIEIVPFETIRGRSFDDSFVILDEAQNTTVPEMKAFLTRVGKRSTVVVNGDETQSDLLKESLNGLEWAVNVLDKSEKLKKYVKLVEFSSDDIVRSGLCQLWVEEIDNYNENCLSSQTTPHFLRP